MLNICAGLWTSGIEMYLLVWIVTSNCPESDYQCSGGTYFLSEDFFNPI
jgi:hypothetical protein